MQQSEADTSDWATLLWDVIQGPGPGTPSLLWLHQVQHVALKTVPQELNQLGREELMEDCKWFHGVDLGLVRIHFPLTRAGLNAGPWPPLPAGEPWKCGLAVCQCLSNNGAVSALCGHHQEAFDSPLADSLSKSIGEYLLGQALRDWVNSFIKLISFICYSVLLLYFYLIGF